MFTVLVYNANLCYFRQSADSHPSVHCMHIASVLQHNLRTNLTSLLDGCQTQPQLNQLIAVSHSLAVAYLGRRISNGSFNRSLLPFSTDDIAYDCIADLYECDESGRYVQLLSYFNGIQLERESDQALLIHLRRLTFSKVNHGIFRMYNEADPSLGKILRNIKGAVASLNNFHETEIFGEQYLSPSCCDLLQHLPLMEHGYFEEQFSRDVYTMRHVPALLGRLSLFLREQSEFRRSVSLMSAALVFRNVFTRQEQPALVEPSVEAVMEREDAKNIVRRACAEMKKEMSPRYVGKRRVDPLVFSRYFDVIESHLLQTVVERDGHEFSFFHTLRSHMPELTKKEYQDHHKSILEYAARLTREKTLALFKAG